MGAVQTNVAEVPVVAGESAPEELDVLAALAADAVQVARGNGRKEFKSGNTGLYANKVLKAPDARALGIDVPRGGRVKVTVQVLVIDPANSPDA